MADIRQNRDISPLRIIRMLNNAFDQSGHADTDFNPEHLRSDIDAINKLVYNKLNNGVY